MASRGQGRGRRGCPLDASEAPPSFDQQAFIEAMGAAFTTIAKTSADGGQGGPSNLQRFKTHHPPKLTRGGDPMVADHCFRHVEKIFEAMEITSNATKIRLAAFQLEGESQVWWD